MNPHSSESLGTIANEVRARILEMSTRAQTPHVAGALSAVEGLVALYFGSSFRLSAHDIRSGASDTVIFSKGHAISALYSVLSVNGILTASDLLTYNESGGRLPEQPAAHGLEGVEWATGSLGHGLSVGLGMALARERQGDPRRVVVFMSDGDCQEGSVWEAIMLARHHRLNNLTAIVDANGWQATDRVTNVTNLYPVGSKFAAFDWHATTVDGRDVSAVAEAITAASNVTDGPSVVVMDTVKGQGVALMEDDNNWHYRSPTASELAEALAVLRPR